MNQQKSLWRVSGIDLFVCLDIDSSESPNSEMSFPPATFDPPISRRDQGNQVLLPRFLENRAEEFSRAEPMVKEAGEHLHNVTARSSLVTPPSVETVQTPSSPGELQLGEALPQESLPWISAPDEEVWHCENEGTSTRPPTSATPGGDLAMAMADQPWESTAMDCDEDVQEQIGAEAEDQFFSDDQLCSCDRSCCDKHYSCPCDQIWCEECPYLSSCPYMSPCCVSCDGACDGATNELENGRDRQNRTGEDDLEEEDKFLKASYKCIANRCWSPPPEDNEWPSSPAQGAADPQGQLQSPRTVGEFRKREWTTEFDEDWELGVTDPPSSGSTSSEISSEDAVAVHDRADPDLRNEPPVPLRLSPVIESFDAMEVRAACQLVELRNSDNSDTVIDEQSALEERDRYKSGLPDLRDPEELARKVGEVPVSPAVSHVYHEEIAYDVPPEQVEEPRREYEMPAAMVIDRDHVFHDHVNEFNRRRASSSTAPGGGDFEDDDGEILERPPRKRQYKSLRELM